MRSKILNKSGAEIVEAAIVLPIFILIIASLVWVCIFSLNSMKARCGLQRQVIDSINREKAVVRTIELSKDYSSRTKGFYGGYMTDDYRARGYILDQGAMIRTGNYFGLIK